MNGLSRILLVICFALIGGLFFGYLKYTEMQKKYELELEIANKKIQSLTENVNKISEELTEANQQIITLKDAVAQKEKQIYDINQDLEAANERLKVQTERATIAEAKADSLEETLDAAKSEYRSLEEALFDKEAELKKIREQIFVGPKREDKNAAVPTPSGNQQTTQTATLPAQ